jgi:ribonuclease D
MLIHSTQKLAAVCRNIKNSGAPLCFDTEFASERRYRPALFLVQIGVVSQEYSCEAIVDPLAVDLAPFLELVGDPEIEKVLHAGSQDLQILWDSFGCEAHNIFDTQIAAAFLGYGNQIGYADLAKRIADAPVLSKDFQFSDWSARPLSEAQMEYALADVRYLPAMHARLKRDLEKRGRLSWAQTEFACAEEKARTETPPEELYKKLNTSRLSRRQLATLREMAMTRDEIARRIDKPLPFILPDVPLLQLAKQPPRDAQSFRATRGVPASAGEWAGKFIAAAKRAAQLPESQWPEMKNGSRPDPRIENIAVLLGIVASQRADEAQIARTYLAPREQLTALAAWSIERGAGSTPDESTPGRSEVRPDLPILSDWRGQLVGEELLNLLDGKLAIAINPKTGELEITSLQR